MDCAREVENVGLFEFDDEGWRVVITGRGCGFEEGMGGGGMALVSAFVCKVRDVLRANSGEGFLVLFSLSFSVSGLAVLLGLVFGSRPFDSRFVRLWRAVGEDGGGGSLPGGGDVGIEGWVDIVCCVVLF